MIATGVPAPSLMEAWPGLWPSISKAYERSPDKCDLIAGIRSQDLQLWGVYDKATPVAGIVTKLLRRVVGTSSELHCHVWLIGGSCLSSWAADFTSKLKPWAKSEGCCAITGNGRIGWTRIMGRLGFRRVEDLDGLPCWRLDL